MKFVKIWIAGKEGTLAMDLHKVLLILVILYICSQLHTYHDHNNSLLAMLQLLIAENCQHWFKVITVKKKKIIKTNTVFFGITCIIKPFEIILWCIVIDTTHPCFSTSRCAVFNYLFVFAHILLFPVAWSWSEQNAF